MLHRRLLLAFSIIGCLLAAPSVSHAGPGLRLGVTDDPDSIFVGVHWKFELGRLGPGELRVQPGVDFGIVDGPVDFLFKGAAHFAWEFPLSRDLRIYPLLGPTLTLITFDDRGNGDNSDLDVNVDLGVGLGFDKFALELWAGFDYPDLSLLISFTL